MRGFWFEVKIGVFWVALREKDKMPTEHKPFIHHFPIFLQCLTPKTQPFFGVSSAAVRRKDKIIENPKAGFLIIFLFLYTAKRTFDILFYGVSKVAARKIDKTSGECSIRPRFP